MNALNRKRERAARFSKAVRRIHYALVGDGLLLGRDMVLEEAHAVSLTQTLTQFRGMC